jgi:glutamine amidotransferase
VLAEVVSEVEAAAPGSKLNLLLTDGVEVHATAWRHALSTFTEADSVHVASEPSDELPGWTPVPDRHVVVAAPGTVTWIAVEDAVGAPLQEPLATLGRSTDQRGTSCPQRYSTST